MTSLKLPKGVLAQHVIALGKTGAGKSSALRVLVEELLEANRPVCIIDPKGDWYGLKSSADGKRAGFPVVIFGGEHADVPINEHAGAHVAELIATGNRSCLIDLGGWMVGERTRFFIAFAANLFKHSRGARHLFIDEVHNFAPQGKIMDPDAGRMLHWTNRLASEGRGKGITIVAASQRPQKVHKDFVTSCETLIAMRVIHKLDRDAIKDWIDGCADPRKGTEVLTSLAQMKRGEAWVWSPEIDFGPVPVTFPMFKTYDSFKPQAADVGKLKGWAEIDLADVRAKLANVVEQAAANDPAALKKRIAELERVTITAAKSIPADAAALAAAERHGAASVQRQLQTAIADAVVTLRSALSTAIDTFAALTVAAVLAEPVPAPVHAALPPPPLPARRPGNGHATVEGITGPQQKILDQLAWLMSKGLHPAPRETLAAVCRVSPRSSSYTNNLGALRTAGLLDKRGDGLVGFTDKGRAAAATPAHSDKPVHEHWFEVVTRPQADILRTLYKYRAGPMVKQHLADEVGVSASSSSFTNNLGALRTLGALDYPSPGQVALTRYVLP